MRYKPAIGCRIATLPLVIWVLGTGCNTQSKAVRAANGSVDGPVSATGFKTKAAEYMDARARVSGFNGAVIVAKNNQVLFRSAYGMASKQFGIQNTPETKFRMGSVTKQFTAAAILLLEQRKQLSVSDPIERYLPDWPAAWKGVTLHHLLSHTAGLPRLSIAQPLPDVSGLSRTAQLSIPKSIIDLARPEEKLQPLDFVPGKGWAYSNIGYAVLGEVIEKVSGKTYREFMRDEIFVPLGMKNTDVEEPARIVDRLAGGYTRVDGELMNAGYVDLRFIRATGSVYSTLDDLLLWHRALQSDRLLSQKEIAKLFSPVRSGYGYGWWIQTRLGRAVQWHRGNVQGFVSVIVRFPDSDLFLAVLSNIERSEVLAVAMELAAIALGEPYEVPLARVAAPINAAAFDSFLGSYRAHDNPEDVFTLRRDGDRLLIDIKGAGAFEVLPWSTVRLFARGFEWDITLVPDTEGRLTNILRRRDGETLRFIKIP